MNRAAAGRCTSHEQGHCRHHHIVVIRSAPADSTSVAVAVNAVTRNTAVAIGAQVAFAIVAGPDVAGAFPAESGYTWAFAMGGLGAGLLLLASTLMPAQTVAARASR